MVSIKSIMIFNSFCKMSFQIFAITGSVNGLWPIPYQAITSTMLTDLSIGPPGTHLIHVLSIIQILFLHSRKCIWNFLLQNVTCFVWPPMSHKILKYFDKYSQPSHNFIRLLCPMSWLKSHGQIYIWINVNVNIFITHHVYNSITADNAFDFAKKASCYSNIDDLTHWGLVMPYGIRKLCTKLVPVMTCCLTAPSQYLKQCWLIVSEDL